MSEEEIDTDEMSLEEIAQNVNPLFFELLKDRVLRFDLKRSLQINTFLLNYFLIQNYFPSLYIQDEICFGKKLSDDKAVEARLFRTFIERLHGIFIMIPMKYKTIDKYTQGQTDKIIDRIDAYGEITNQFYFLNQNPIEISINSLEEILEEYSSEDRWLPDLEFDPEFKKIIKSEAIQQLFFINTPKDYIIKKGIQRYKYHIDDYLNEEYQKGIKDKYKMLFRFSPDLVQYPHFLINAGNFFLVPDFGAKALIHEITENFFEYYSKRIPSRNNEIRQYLLCFELLFTLSEGKLYKEIPWRALNDRLAKVTSEKIKLEFLERFCMDKTFIKFPESLQDFKIPEFFNDYHDFLTIACYCYSANVYTGVMVIWRSLLKYLEELQRTNEFRNTKGKLLENWCLEKAEEYSFQAEKIILINSSLSPSKRYKEMKSQIDDFPKLPLEFEADFFEGKNKYYFQEIDLAIREGVFLYLIECKSTSVPFSQEKKYVKWAENFEQNFNLLNIKLENLDHNLENGYIKHPFFTGVKIILPIIIQTEGIFHHTFGFSTDKYLSLLKNFRKYADEGKLESLYREFFR